MMPLLAFQFCSRPDAPFCLTLSERFPLNLPYLRGKVLLSTVTALIHFAGALEGTLEDKNSKVYVQF